MFLSEQWLRLWINPDASTQQLCNSLTLAGLEVDGIRPASGGFAKVVIANLKDVSQHPTQPQLQVVNLDYGASDLAQVVIEQSSLVIGSKMVYAPPGAVLADDKLVEAIDIEQVSSAGLLCSSVDLGLDALAPGFIVLDQDAPVGTDYYAYLALDDTIISIDLTPNRGDCLSVAGIARELSAIYQLPTTEPEFSSIEPSVEATVPVTVLAPKDCPRYIGRVITGIKQHATTPMWIKERLRRSGVRCISPVVDIANYVMFELGQPMHAFDRKCLAGGIIVRKAHEQEKLTLLDGQEINMSPEHLVIADEQKALALAGIMGGLDSAVGSETQDIFLESAFFNPVSLAGVSRSFGFSTDSAHRFERGVDSQLQRKAIERATELLLATVGGLAGPLIEVAATEMLPPPVSVLLRPERIKRVLGQSISTDDIERDLTNLGMSLEADSQGWQVTVPSHRSDINLEIDCIEEIARLYGYHKLAASAELNNVLAFNPKSEAVVAEPRLGSVLVDLGYQEVINYSFVDEHRLRQFDHNSQPLALVNPISADMNVMRTSLWPGLLKNLSYNLNRQQSRVRLFEIGLRFIQEAELTQQNVISGLAYGCRHREQWSVENRDIDYYDIKGDVECLIELTGADDEFSFVAGKHPALHVGCNAQIWRNGECIGYLGALNPKIVSALGEDIKVYVFEIVLDKLVPANIPNYTELSKFPSIRRDLAFLVDEHICVDDIFKVVNQNSGKWLKKIHLFDVYRGDGVPSGKKSLAIGLTLQHESRTLVDEEVNEFMQTMVNALEGTFAAIMRI